MSTLTPSGVTNLERWRFYLKSIEAPDAFIDWSFYWMISASLQRRVWWGSTERPLYPNLYVFLVADPGIGKSITIGPVKQFLEWHKLKDKGPFDADSIFKRIVPADLLGGTTAHDHHQDVSGNMLLPNASKRNEQKEDEDNHLQLFPSGADCTTYEQLIHDMARSTRMVSFETIRNGTSKKGLYTHNTMAMMSTELSNLLKKNTENIVNFLLEGYDCKDRYEYRTKNMGKDMVTKVCVNFLAGTTPDYMEEAFDDSIINGGMSARSIFVFAFANRFQKWNISEMSLEQIMAKAQLLSWMRKLATLYGEVKLAPDAEEYMKYWYENIHNHSRINKDSKLISYYGRKRVHLVKLIMAMHFADSTEMVIPIETCIKALEFLENTEKYMHLALQVASKNPFANIARNIVRFLVVRANEPVTFKDLLSNFYTEAKTADLQEIVQYMVTTGKLVTSEEDKVQYYRLPPNHAAEDQLEIASDRAFAESRGVVHPSLDKRIRWGRNGKVLVERDTPLPELQKLRALMIDGTVKGVSSIQFVKG
jgi:hypothetical protein